MKMFLTDVEHIVPVAYRVVIGEVPQVFSVALCAGLHVPALRRLHTILQMQYFTNPIKRI